MPRIRSIKPEFWADEKLSLLLPLHRLVFLALCSLADDAGRLVDSVKQLDGAIFPHTEDTCRDSLDVLDKLGRIQRGTTDSGQRIIQLVNWHHQKIDKPNMLAALPPITSPVVPRDVGDDSTNGRRHVDASTSIYDLLSTINDQRPLSEGDVALVFEACWQLYPKRAGGNSKIATRRQFEARIKAAKSASVEITLMLAGTKRYATFIKATGKEGSQYVKQGATFYGRDRHFTEEWKLPRGVKPPRDPGSDASSMLDGSGHK